jgi:hypothetical protein
MKIRGLVIMFLLALAVVVIAGCGTANPYRPPNPGEPRATFYIHNDCDFTLYLMIDNQDFGPIYRGDDRQIAVTPGNHVFEFTGTDYDYNDDGYPVYFATSHLFRQDEIYPMKIRFGIDF